METFIFKNEKYEILVTKDDIENIIKNTAKIALDKIIELNMDEVVAIVVYKGAIYFATKFLTYLQESILDQKLDIDIIDEGIIVKAYDEDNVPLKNIQILYDLKLNIRNKHVFLIEDYADRCFTFSSIIENIKGRSPASLTSFVLFGNNGYCQELLKNQDIVFGHILTNPGWITGYGLDDRKRRRGWPFLARKLEN